MVTNLNADTFYAVMLAQKPNGESPDWTARPMPMPSRCGGQMVTGTTPARPLVRVFQRRSATGRNPSTSAPASRCASKIPIFVE